MENHEGLIDICSITNTGDGADLIGTVTARFVRYPGSQQVTVWLPESGWNGYGSVRIINRNSQQIIQDIAVCSMLNGNVMLLWDTIGWEAGTYLLEIEHPKGGKHELELRKLEEGEGAPKEKIVEMPVATSQSPSLIESHLLQKSSPSQPNTDHSTEEENSMLRSGLIANLTKLFAEKINNTSRPRLSYTGNVRAGTVIYTEGDIRIEFWHEMGGGDCKLFINIPTSEDWETATGTPLSRRDEILRFVANTVRREQAPSWRYEIHEHEIVYF